MPPMQHIALDTTLLILVTVLFVNILFRAIRLPVILGYVITGATIGPYALGWVTNLEAIQYFAEFGVVFLMFTIGLEFSFSKLLTLRYAVFVLGGLQVLITIMMTLLLGLLLTLTPSEALVIGCVVAMSSTALVVKQLSEQLEVHSPHGLNAIGILLMQDLAVVPILIVIVNLGEIDHQTLWETLTLSLVRALIAIGVIIAIGRWLLKPLFRMIGAIDAGELFTLTALFVVLGSAWLTESLGMTYALGAFLSGIMLGETEFRAQIKEEIRPFRDVFLGLFFVSVGMLAQLGTWHETWYWILLIVTAVMVGKTLLIILLCRLSAYKPACAIRTGIILAQGGEFGFAILTLALAKNILPDAYGQVVLAALLISFAAAPFLIRYNERIADWITRRRNE